MPETSESALARLKGIPGLQRYCDAATPMDDVLFAHIHLSREMGGLEAYQGSLPEITTAYAAKTLENLETAINPIAADLKTAIQSRNKFLEALNRPGQRAETALEELLIGRIIESDSSVSAYGSQQHKIKKTSGILESQNPFLFPLSVNAGTDKIAGHGLLVEFFKYKESRQDFYRVRVFNAGDGLEYHPKADFGKVYTVVERTYDEADFKKFIQNLKGLRQNITTQSFYETFLSEEDRDYVRRVYETSPSTPGNIKISNQMRIKEHFKPVKSSLSKPMLTGMCGWKMIMAFLKSRLPKREEYLRAKYALYTQALLDYYLTFLNNPTYINARHLEWGMNNYARFLNDKVQKPESESVQAGERLSADIAKSLKVYQKNQPVGITITQAEPTMDLIKVGNLFRYVKSDSLAQNGTALQYQESFGVGRLTHAEPSSIGEACQEVARVNDLASVRSPDKGEVEIRQLRRV